MQRQVTPEEGKELAKEFNNCAFIETSARHDDGNITQAFQLLVGEIEKHENPQGPKSEGCIIS